MRNILIKGAGIGGLTAAYEFMNRGATVTVTAPEDSPYDCASWFAGGMLAPYCERESAEQVVEDLGLEAMRWWDDILPGLVTHNGTLVVAPPRDSNELKRFSSRTAGHEEVDGAKIAELEPDLAGRFQRGLYYPTEALIDARRAMDALKTKLQEGGVTFVPMGADEKGYDFIIDCTGIARMPHDHELRGVRGEMLLVRSTDVKLTRTVRLVHPRIPLYIAPREDNIFMIGATMIESDSYGPIRARSMMEFLNAAYTVHPGFAEAEIVEAGVGVRPAYPDNFPRVKKEGNTIAINGFYRHGYLLSPEMAKRAVTLALGN